MTALRGAEAPLFHGITWICACAFQVKIKVKGSGQECPLHTGNVNSRFLTGLGARFGMTKI
jgi:hypothetical protein